MLGINKPINPKSKDHTWKLEYGLSYCPICYKEDKTQYGEPYIHRSHQLNGMLICPYHRCYLHRIKPQKNKCIRKISFYCLNEKDITRNKIEFCHDNKIIDYSICLFRMLTSQSYREKYPDNYKSILNTKGYFQRGSCSVRNIIRAFDDYYENNKLLKTLNIGEVSSEKYKSWIHILVYNKKTCKSYSKHVLFWCFLKNTKEVPEISFDLEQKKSHKRIDIGYLKPFRCFNKAAAHYNKRVINDHKILSTSPAYLSKELYSTP
jgi:hypothetical protein